MTISSSRRGFLAALSAIGLTGAPAAAQAVLHTPDPPSPDAELLAAGLRLAQAAEHEQRADAASATARGRFHDALGWCPISLLISRDDQTEWELLRHLREHGGLDLTPDWDRFEHYGDDGMDQRWTGPMLRATLRSLRAINKRGGRTPNLIRHYRSLVLVADDRDSTSASWRERLDLDRLSDECRRAQEAVAAAQAEVEALPATTLAGLAVKARHAQAWVDYNQRRGGWSLKLPACVQAVLTAASAVTSTEASR